LVTVAAADTLFFIDDDISRGQLGNGTDRADTGAGRLNAVLARPVIIYSLFSVLCIGPEVYDDPVIGSEIRFSVGLQLVSLYIELVPPLAGRHTPLAANTSGCIYQFAVT
jgi:hypothetical protein